MKKLLIALMIAACSCTPEDVIFELEPIEGDATEMIQEKLDACNLAGGGKVVLNEGTYLVGGLFMKSNTTLYLKSGAELCGHRDCALYRPSEDTFIWDTDDTGGRRAVNAASQWNDAIIRIYKAENVAVIGEKGSVIDGNNSYNPDGEEHYRGVHGISAHKCSNLHFEGYTIRNTGNWAHNVWKSTDVVFANLTIRAGHDGVHFRGCTGVKVENCDMQTGDDSIAGFDNQNVTINNCSLNTSCSAFRFGGTHVSIDNCRCYGPGVYPHRGTLTDEQKAAGAMASDNEGRRNMLSVFTYFADKSLPIREQAGDITITNMSCENVDRFLHYNLSGNETWQQGMPLQDITFKNVSAEGIKMPLCAYADENIPFRLTLENCNFSFDADIQEFIKGAYINSLELSNVSIKSPSEIPLVRIWAGEKPEINLDNVSGITPEVASTEEPFKTANI